MHEVYAFTSHCIIMGVGVGDKVIKPIMTLKVVSATFLLVCFVSLKEGTFETKNVMTSSNA